MTIVGDQLNQHQTNINQHKPAQNSMEFILVQADFFHRGVGQNSSDLPVLVCLEETLPQRLEQEHLNSLSWEGVQSFK